MAEKELSEIFKEAAEIAKLVPENMQEAAFNRAIDLLTATSTHNTSIQRSGDGTHAGSQTPVSEKGVDDLISAINSTHHPEIKRATKALDLALMVLKLALDDHGIDGLTTPEISKVLTEKFRIGSKANSESIRKALSRASDLVDRIQVGRTHKFRIMSPGEEYLAKLAAGETLSGSSTKSSKSSSPKRKRVVKKSKDTASSEKSNKKAVKPGSGANAMLNRAIDEGFLSTPRTIGQICEHSADNYARRIKPNEISGKLARMVRENELSRKKNSDGQYEYTAS